jgi:hypothetical protein
MKIVMTLLVRDAEDLIRQHIQYHLARGVDHFIITDNLSVDGTRDILEEFRKLGVAEIIDEKTDDYSQSQWVTRMARLAATRHHADWVINSDDDEFWWPQSPTLQEALEGVPANQLALDVERNDFIPTVSESDHPLRRMLIRETQSKKEDGKRLRPKVIHRGISDAIVGQGNHRIQVSCPIDAETTRSIEILHFPLRTYRQFENKISKGGRAYSNNVILRDTNAGLHWKKYYQYYLAGSLQQEYEKKKLPSETLEKRLADGSLTEDSRLFDFLTARGIL